MPDPNLDEINATTLKEIYPRTIEDNFFKNAPMLAYLRAHALVPYTGGARMQQTIAYAPMNGGAYARGGTFNINKPTTLTALLHDPKYYYTNVTEYAEDIQVVNKGAHAVFSLIDSDLAIGMNSMNTQIAIALARHGRGTTTGVVGNRANHINGWVEALNDGVTPGWEGSVFTEYGEQPRNGAIGSVINSVPYWCGDSEGNAGPIHYALLEETYQDATVGNEEPNLGVGNKLIIAFIKERIQPQQRFAQERDPYFGASGLKMNSAMILKDDYFPSARYGENNATLGSYLTGTFTSPAAGIAASSNMPANKTINVGEVFGWFNTKKWSVRISDNKEFGFGFSGFKPEIDTTRVAGQIKAAINLQCRSPRHNKQLFGING